METIIGFVAGYLTGVSEGREGMQRARKSLDAIRTSPEVRRMVADGVGLAQGILGRIAKGGLSGVVAGKAIERLGIVEQMKAKTTLVPGAQSPDLVAKGEVELGIAQASEIVPTAGTQLVGPLPGELGSLTRFSGGIGAESASVNAAKALIDFLAGPEAVPHFKAKGFEPGG